MSASGLPHGLRTRLIQDLAELEDSPYPGVAVFTDDANIRKLCLVLTPPSGPWKDLALHFDVTLPPDWPAYPPIIKSSVSEIQHPNLFGEYICCDLLKSRNQLEAGYTGGYTPALTLRGLFLQFLTFFSSTSVEQDDGYTIHIGDYIFDHFATEDDFLTTLLKGSCCYIAPCRCRVSEKGQRELEQLWRASRSSEVTIGIYQLQDQTVSHFSKVVTGEVKVHRFSRINPRWKATHDIVSTWQCPQCPYGSESLPAHRKAPENTLDGEGQMAANLVPPPSCLLWILNDDVLLELSTYMLSESVVDFSTAYPRFHHLITSTRELLQRELRCFFLRASIHESILGVGVTFDPQPRTLSSDFDWLSKQAFDQYGVRTSIQKREFQYFLPLAFSRPHFERVQKDIWLHLQYLDEAVRKAESAVFQRMTIRTGAGTTRRITAPRKAHQVVDIVYRMMNNIVVSLMKSCDNVLDVPSIQRGRTPPAILHASEKAVVSYCHLFHLLLSLTRSTPAILRDATDRLRRFIMVPESRIKTEVPDLGELIVLITLVLACPPIDNATPMTWNMLNGPFLEEAITRNVRWMLADNPELEVLEEGASEYRLYKTFFKARTSLRLIMFQIAFLSVFVKTYAGHVERLDENYGFPEPRIPERMVKEVKAIYRVETWLAFFERVQYAKGTMFGAAKMSDLLRCAVRNSGRKGYHAAKKPRELHILAKDRDFLERKWIKARKA